MLKSKNRLSEIEIIHLKNEARKYVKEDNLHLRIVQILSGLDHGISYCEENKDKLIKQRVRKKIQMVLAHVIKEVNNGKNKRSLGNIDEDTFLKQIDELKYLVDQLVQKIDSHLQNSFSVKKI